MIAHHVNNISVIVTVRRNIVINPRESVLNLISSGVLLLLGIHLFVFVV